MTVAAQIYLTFDGNCEEAFRFYVERLGATADGVFRYGGSPMESDVPPDWSAKIMHGSVTLGTLKINGADVTNYVVPTGFHVFLEHDDPAEVERLYATLAENGTIEMPLQQTFWSVRFGVLRDQFGVPWTLSCAQIPAEPGR